MSLRKYPVISIRRFAPASMAKDKRRAWVAMVKEKGYRRTVKRHFNIQSKNTFEKYTLGSFVIP